MLQKKSWRAISNILLVGHLPLYNFYNNYHSDPEIIKIFHSFAVSRIIVFVGANKTFSSHQIDNSEHFLKLTLDELERIL